MQPRAHLEVMNPVERRVFRAKRLGLDPERFTIFLATGGNGANNHFELLPALVGHADRVQAILICGKNRQTYHELVHWRANNPGFTCYVEGYSEIVHLLMQALENALRARGNPRHVVCLLTQVEVDPDDPAFRNPSKPIGYFYTEDEAKDLAAELGWEMREDSGRGWRHVVPSPKPKHIVDISLVQTVAKSGAGVPSRYFSAVKRKNVLFFQIGPSTLKPY